MKSTKCVKRPWTPGAAKRAFELISSIAEGKRRKDVIVACEAAGINRNTAKTQYQRWLNSLKEPTA